ncbi:GntR family transcriptional regulator [Cryobacterium sp. Y62]|uniref:GntR family transcriptional regulator n=1 Tax=Cryobacterium sp. Y62 TaxID=2048284 RepID=UPI000CE466C8|nr:GntR family transcriptional regulator [Cryobacterium sp. Y62]
MINRFSAPQHLLLPDIVAEQLAQEIILGTLEPGVKLNEAKLAERLGVSRLPLREALQQLVSDGLVVSERRGGTWVAPVDSRTVGEFYDCRILMEGECASLAAPHLSDSDISRAKAVLDELKGAGEQGLLNEWLKHVESFHDVYREACPNKQLVAIVRTLTRRTLRYRVIGIAQPFRSVTSLEQHEEVLHAMERRDASRLKASVIGLLSSSKENILASKLLRSTETRLPASGRPSL